MMHPNRRLVRAAFSLFASALALFAAAPLLFSAAPAGAQTRQASADAPLLRIEAQASREVTDDIAVAVFFLERDGQQPAALQSAVNAVLQSALADLKRDPALQVRSGAYYTQPRSGRDGRIEAWRVRAELVAESTDAAAISRASTALDGRMNVGSLGFRLSPARRADAEQALIAEAAERFFARGRAAAAALGYAEVELVDANVGAGAPTSGFVRPAMARGEFAADAVPLPIEPGRSQVNVTIAGVLRMKRP